MEPKKLAEAYGGDLSIKHNNYLPLEEGATTYPDHAAVIAMHQFGNHLASLTPISKPLEPPLSWTHRDLSAAALNLAQSLSNHVVQRSGTLVMLFPNRLEWAVLLYATVMMGLTFVPLDFGMTTDARREELAGLLGTLKPDVIVVGDGKCAAAVDRALSDAEVRPTLRLVLDSTVLNEDIAGWSKFSSIGAEAESDHSHLLDTARQENPDHTAFIYFTSGTSAGNPKGCPRTVASMSAVLETSRDQLQFNETSRFLLISTNFRVISLLALCAWREGAAIVMPDSKFTPQTALDAIERHKVTHILLVPALLLALLDDPHFESRDVPSVSHLFLSGDIITRDVFFKAVKAFPHAKVVVTHGMTEGRGLFSWPYWGVRPEEIPFHGEIAPIGVAGPGSGVRIADDISKETVLRGKPGELHLNSPNVIRQYLGGMKSEDFYDDAHGRWFKTGDLASMSADGVVYILGRVKDRIKRAGVPITPAALESSVDKFTVSHTSVIGMPHPVLGQEPFAVVQSLGERSKDGVRQHILELFGKDYALAGVASLDELGLESFPLNATGKVMKIELQKLVERYLQNKQSANSSL